MKDEQSGISDIDYEEYLRLKGIEEDKEDYVTALNVKNTNKTWKDHDQLKNELRFVIAAKY